MQYASKFGKLSSSHRSRKGQFSLQSQRGQCQRVFKLSHNCTHLTHYKVMLKILQARLQQYVTVNFQMFKLDLEKAGTRDQTAKVHWIIKKAREFQKNIYFCFIDYAKAFDCVDHDKLWEILRERNTRPPDLPPEKSVCRSRSNS